MRSLLRILLPMLLGGAGIVASFPASAAEAAVSVTNTGFSPADVRIEPGDSVAWTWKDGGHTVTADGGAFSSGERGAGATFGHTFTDAGTFAYRCTLHDFMKGTVQVGPPPPPPPPLEVARIYVPSQVPSIGEAVRLAKPDTEIVLDPAVAFTVDRPVLVETDGITITTGAPPTDDTTTSSKQPARKTTTTTTSTTTTSVPAAPMPAAITRAGDVEHAFDVAADRVTLEHLDIGDFVVGAVRVTDSRNVVLRELRLTGPRDYGIQALRSNVSVTDVTASGYRRAAVAFHSCEDCGVVTRLDASRSFVGFEAVDAASVVLRGSRIHDNANGVIIQTRDAGGTGAAGADVLGNDILHNTRTDLMAPTVFDDRVQPAAGVGIWLAGARQSQVRSNDVIGAHRWGIVASALGGTASDDAITDNAVEGSTVADLAWDGIGAGTCFARNTAPNTRPTVALYTCGGVAPTVGVPDPTVTGDIVLSSLTTYYCREIAAC